MQNPNFNNGTPFAFSPSDGAKMLAISRATFDREVARGHLRVLKIGAATRVTATELQRYLSSLPMRCGKSATREAQ